MLSKSELEEIREHLQNAQNPVFYYDNDADGLCSFLLLRRFIGRGKGVAVRSFPDLNKQYARKAVELNADYVFVLDKPILSREFAAEIDSIGLPLVWIDHHDVVNEDLSDFKNIFSYNSSKNGGAGEPVTFLSYKISENKEDVWLAMIGCISDHYLPDFVDEFKKNYSELWGEKILKPFDAYFGTEIGKISQSFNFGLKDSVSNVVRMQNFLISVKSPTEVLSESTSNHSFRKKYSEVKKKYDELLLRAKKNAGEKLVFFYYSGDLSISSDLSNNLTYIFPGKYVVVSYVKGDVASLSFRGKGVKKILEKILKEIEGRGGGHEDAVGARISASDLEKFRELVEREISE